MAKNVIIDWQKDSLIVGTGNRRGGGVVFDQLRIVSLAETDRGLTSPSQALRKLVQEMGLGKSDAIVIASRENVEVRTVSVPNVEPDELPDIIRYQAQRQMANMGESWPLDFILLPGSSNESRIALAAALSPAHIAEYEAAVTASGLHLKQILLRPIEIVRFAMMADTSGRMKDGAAVILCLTDQHSDLLLLSSGAVVQLRSTRLPSDPVSAGQTLVSEIKRSLVAASAQLNGQSIISALLIAPADLAAKVESTIAQAIGCDVSVVDPMVMLPLGTDQSEALTHTASNRLAALAGVIGTPAPDKRTVIDFKNPKKRPPKQVNVRKYAIAGGLAVTVALGGIYWLYSTHQSMNEELALLKREINDKRPMADLARKQVADFNAVKKVLDSSPNWLAELETIALNKPSSDKVILYNPVFSVGSKGEAIIKSKVYGVSPSLISEFESSLRSDEKFTVNTTERSNTEAWAAYPWESGMTVSATDRGWKLLDPPAKVNTKATAPEKAPGNSDPQAAGPQEVSKEETSKQETPKQETSKQETSKQETSKQETPKQESPKQETPKQETPLPEAHSKTTGSPESGRGDSQPSPKSENAAPTTGEDKVPATSQPPAPTPQT